MWTANGKILDYFGFYFALTGAVSELKSEVRPTEPVYGDGQLDDFSPSRAVIVVKDERVVRAPARLSWAQTDAVLEQNKTQLKIKRHHIITDESFHYTATPFT